MIITITGKPGSGKSTIAKMLAAHYNLKHYSAGDFMREIAKKRNMSLMQLTLLAEKGIEIDKEIDMRTLELAKKEKSFIIDSRLAFHFVENAIKVFLDVDEETGAERIFKAMRADERENTSYDATLENIMRRERSECERFLRYYKIEIYDMENYDIVVNTTKLGINEVFDAVKKEIKEKFRL